jgi:hypothetical protein
MPLEFRGWRIRQILLNLLQNQRAYLWRQSLAQYAERARRRGDNEMFQLALLSGVVEPLHAARQERCFVLRMPIGLFDPRHRAARPTLTSRTMTIFVNVITMISLPSVRVIEPSQQSSGGSREAAMRASEREILERSD